MDLVQTIIHHIQIDIPLIKLISLDRNVGCMTTIWVGKLLVVTYCCKLTWYIRSYDISSCDWVTNFCQTLSTRTTFDMDMSPNKEQIPASHDKTRFNNGCIPPEQVILASKPNMPLPSIRNFIRNLFSFSTPAPYKSHSVYRDKLIIIGLHMGKKWSVTQPL